MLVWPSANGQIRSASATWNARDMAQPLKPTTSNFLRREDNISPQVTYLTIGKVVVPLSLSSHTKNSPDASMVKPVQRCQVLLERGPAFNAKEQDSEDAGRIKMTFRAKW